MSINKKILFVGPLPPPITGQAFAFNYFFSSYKGSKIVIDTNSKDGKFVSAINYLYVLLKVILISLTSKYDLVYFTCSRTKGGAIRDICLINCASWRNKPIINHLHGADFKSFYDEQSNVFKKTIKYTYNKIAESVILLDEMKSEFSDYEGRMIITTVPNFYDPELDAEQTKCKSEKIKIIYFSNLIYSKGILDLLEAFDSVAKENQNIELLVAGKVMSDGYKTKDEMEILLKKYWNHSRIRYLGLLTGKEKRDFLFNADIFVLPSFYISEAFPITIIEAMRAGCAIICTNHNYLPNVVNQQNGFVVNKKNIEELENAIRYLVENRQELEDTQDYNRKYAINNYAPEKYITSLNEVINKYVE